MEFRVWSDFEMTKIRAYGVIQVQVWHSTMFYTEAGLKKSAHDHEYFHEVDLEYQNTKDRQFSRD